MTSEIGSMVERFSDAEMILWAERGGEVPRRRQAMVDDWYRQVRAEAKLQHLPSLTPEVVVEPAAIEVTKPIKRGHTKGTPVILVRAGEVHHFHTQAEAAKSIGVRPGTLFEAMKRGGKTRDGWEPRRAA